MTILHRVALAALLTFGAAAPFAPVAVAQEQKAIDAQEVDATLRKATDQLETKDWDGAIATYAALEKLVPNAKIDASKKEEALQLIHYNTACAWSLKGEKTKALDSFEKSLEAGFYDFDHIEEDTDLDNIREDPRFVALVKKHAALAEKRQGEMVGKAKDEFVARISKDALFPFDFDITGIDGKPLKLSDYKGKVTLVDVWGTWCPPCRMEVPHLVELHKKLSPKGFDIAGLNFEKKSGDAAKADVKEFIAEEKIPYRCGMLDRTFLEKNDIEAFPTMLLLDKQGHVRLKQVGFVDGALLEAAVEKLLAEPAWLLPPGEKKPEEKKPAPKGGSQEF